MKLSLGLPALALAIMLLAPSICPAGERTEDMSDAKALLKGIDWIGHDTFQIVSGDTVIYTDPFKVSGDRKADLILITHEHYDHCSPEDVAKILKPETVIVTVSDCASKLGGNVRVVQPGDKLSVAGVEITAVPAYNLDKKFHTRDRAWVGYIFSVGGRRIYLAGDTDRIPEMKTYRCEVALLPVGGTYVMTADEAVSAALDIMPRVAVPMHYGTLSGVGRDVAERFKDGLKGKVEVFIFGAK